MTTHNIRLPHKLVYFSFVSFTRSFIIIRSIFKVSHVSFRLKLVVVFAKSVPSLYDISRRMLNNHECKSRGETGTRRQQTKEIFIYQVHLDDNALGSVSHDCAERAKTEPGADIFGDIYYSRFYDNFVSKKRVKLIIHISVTTERLE